MELLRQSIDSKYSRWGRGISSERESKGMNEGKWSSAQHVQGPEETLWVNTSRKYDSIKA